MKEIIEADTGKSFDILSNTNAVRSQLAWIHYRFLMTSSFLLIDIVSNYRQLRNCNIILKQRVRGLRMAEMMIDRLFEIKRTHCVRVHLYGCFA